VPLLALAACHQEFGTAGHGGPAIGTGHPSATALRTGEHAGFDRVVVQFSGTTVPAYFAEYVPANQLIAPSGMQVPVRGTHFLRLRFDGLTTGPAPLGTTPEGTQVRQVKQVDNSGGVLVYGVGVRQHTPFRVFALENPSRVVLDIRH
jgi:hypothetical protein